MELKNDSLLNGIRYYEIFDRIQESIMVFDVKRNNNNKIVDLVFRYINPVAAHNFGIIRKEIINISFNKLYNSEFTAPYLDNANKICANVKDIRFETYFAPLDKYFLVSSSFLDSNLYITINTDITELKNKEGILNSDNIFKSIVEQSIDGIMIVNEKGVIIEWNYSMERLTGLKKSNVLNQFVWDILYLIAPPEGRTKVNYNRIRRNTLNFTEIKDTSRLGKLFEDKIQHVDGSIRFLQSLPFLLVTSRGKMICSFHRDITELKKNERELEDYRYHLEKHVEKRTEELIKLANSLENEIQQRKKVELALKENEEKFRELFNNANDMISLNEMKENRLPGRFIEVNDVGVRRLGYSKDELLNMGPIDIVAPDKKIEMPKNAMELWTRGHVKFEIVHLAKDGKRIPVEVNNHLFKLKGKTVALAISRDITKRKKTEKEMKKLINDLKRSNNELEQFAYVASHDLQEPLRTIASFTQLLERRYKGKFDKDADEFMDYVINASIRMKNQIEDLLEFSRIATLEKTFKIVNMNNILGHIISNLKTLIEENNAEITYDPLPEVMGDDDQLQRVFQNLIINSIKFKKEDEPPKIHISVNKDLENNEYVFSIVDNGIGIEEQYMERIFVIFQRLHTQEEYSGTGIGLSIVKRIIEHHNGRIWVESEPGVGSTFYFTIPVIGKANLK
ncbi:PAS domain-containing sensor histidine kinase [Methanobacterium sp.]|uniref:PAS domain-containing sensor histidine kinase n=1 Tax=Methanobacterium sp. TaxID=2164 RepID=UPI003C792CF1